MNDRIDKLELHSEIESVKTDLEHIEEEVNYWNSSLLCYLVKENPPIQVMEGFVRRIWRNYIC